MEKGEIKMRIMCNQCGHSIHSATCEKYCDPEKRQKQYDEAVKEFDKVASEILEIRGKKRRKNSCPF